MEETKVLYHVNDEGTPYLIKLPVPPDRVTLADLKTALNRPNYKYFFKSVDDDFGVVKEEINEDAAHLPCFNGRVVSWLVAASDGSVSDGRSQSDTRSQCAESVAEDLSKDRNQDKHSDHSREFKNNVVESSLVQEKVLGSRTQTSTHRHAARLRAVASSVGTSSDVESRSFINSDDDDDEDYDDAGSKFSATTETTEQSSKYGRQRQRRRRHHMPFLSHASSFSSITESMASLNVLTVILNMGSACCSAMLYQHPPTHSLSTAALMPVGLVVKRPSWRFGGTGFGDRVNFLGISCVGQSNANGDGGIYVGSIMKGGAVALDGRIEPGDMILEVNGISFENLHNDEAVRILREVVKNSGSVKLVVAKCWDPTPRNYVMPTTEQHRAEPIRPIDPSAWIAHTEAVRREAATPTRGMMQSGPSFGGSGSIGSSSLTSSNAGCSSNGFEDFSALSVHTDMAAVARAMARPDSGLEVRDRLWLKITIPNAFIGSDLVNWLHMHVIGLGDRRDARKYASVMLQAGLVRHTVSKHSFSEQCYYIFGDIAEENVPMFGYPGEKVDLSMMHMLPSASKALSSLTLEDIDSVSEIHSRRDTVPRFPLPYSSPAWINQYNHNPYNQSPGSLLSGHSEQKDSVYAPPPPYNLVTANKTMPGFVPGGRQKETIGSGSGSSASGSSRSQGGGGGNGGGGGSSGSSCRKMAMPLICGSVDGVSDQCSTLGSRRYSPNSSKVSMSLCSPYGGGAQLISTSHQLPMAFSVADSNATESLGDL